MDVGKEMTGPSVAICSIIRDPYLPYLMEWLEHHSKLGVDLFFIYDNESSPPISRMISESIFWRKVRVFYVSGVGSVQLPAYSKCIEEIKSGTLPLCDWLAVIDEDEFIMCENGDIKKTLEEYTGYPGLVINWRVYGSSGLKYRTPEPQMKKFTHPTSPNNPINYNVKSIINPLKVHRTRRNPHTFRYLDGKWAVNVNKNTARLLFNAPIYKKMWINHYYTRSKEEWDKKIVRPFPSKKRLFIDPVTKKEVPGFYRDPNQFVEIDMDCEEYAKRGNNNE